MIKFATVLVQHKPNKDPSTVVLMQGFLAKRCTHTAPGNNQNQMKRVLRNTNGYHPMGKPSPLVATIHLAKSTVLLLLLSTEQEPKDARLVD